MDELDITTCKAAFGLINGLSSQLEQTPELLDALQALHHTVLELEAWKKLKDPVILHASLLAGRPAKLSDAMLLHLAGAGECSNAGKCSKKGADRLGQGAGRSQVIETPRLSALTSEQSSEIETWLGSHEGLLAMERAIVESENEMRKLNKARRVSPQAMNRPIV